MEDWEEKAHRIIAEAARASYRQANPPTKRRRAAISPYSLPPLAARLVEILGMHDRGEAERQAKALFIAHACIPGAMDGHL